MLLCGGGDGAFAGGVCGGDCESAASKFGMLSTGMSEAIAAVGAQPLFHSTAEHAHDCSFDASQSIM